mgnify:CR=1 FL=1
MSIDAPLQIAGYCTYLGTTELGMVYQFGLYSGDQLREGTFALDLYNTDYGEMTITPISGVNLFALPRAATPSFPGCNSKQADMVFSKRVLRFK